MVHPPISRVLEQITAVLQVCLMVQEEGKSEDLAKQAAAEAAVHSLVQSKKASVQSGVGRYASCRQLILPLACMYTIERRCPIKLDFRVQFRRTNILKKRAVNIGIKLYTKLPIQIRKVEKIRTYKNELASYLLQRTIYSVDVFYELHLYCVVKPSLFRWFR
ncbi:hypothetical protein L798_00309 [Zootermopsis nevadensis]|uniref:Uncharacterized protein n=1 Tax=Zootermopsis nevadensis TaxID=136037 RepID=A0A067QL95_ZOONE|nr:hypothetical protein L798_00309 [Zootermopsis nevadensis]